MPLAQIPSSDLVVQRPFRFGGTAYESGQTFDWRGLKAPPRRVRQLIEQRRLRSQVPADTNRSNDPGDEHRGAGKQRKK